MRSLLSVAVLLFAAIVSAVSTTDDRLLVVADDVADTEAYGEFFEDLESRKFNIDYKTPKSEGLELFRLGERTYGHLVFLPTKVKALGPQLTPNILIDFVNAGGNILIAQSSTHPSSTSIVSFLNELGISFPVERTGLVVDHFNHDTVSASEKHDVLVLDAPTPVRAGIKPFFSGNEGAVLALPHTVGHTLGAGQLLTPILRAPRTAYSYNPKEQSEAVDPDELFGAGAQLGLVSAFQARNSARVAVLGSAEMLQDKWFAAKVAREGGKETVTANREFAKMLSGWVFQEIGVLRVNGIEHRLKGENETNPSIYRVKNEVTYSISLSEYSWDSWKPFTLPDSDALQLEFSMLSPFHRLDLHPIDATPSATVYGTSFTLPDQHGIFNFRVNYKRPFLTNVDEKRTVSVRHIAHDEWPRSFVISGAWPWISGIGATVTGFVAFCAVWVYSRPAPAKKTQ
ncbi:Dolichyl-diphosphooligosaccharide--protein glycosyltransferase subunit-like protein [Hapsidospora chrysogenum ATCC 11550]|uniref:Dolichyl-diphosphooligosaccharide--protein glycosyltransferase subunit WBP1 n=1 Tax=Hapsidospora chrysogenum (strain ATCC 11550 / CBS 779.69 / DSM 880 / IAM 14645 / JCM 23072 / IMI 49137) TaxID=857340 RepID=A0A086T8G3_HAPC1|nr:Dolichyl-diphosphooligosaccharide--protein glycosyltransferase subunit-like protein [Hapsidospora chrysogenum ATCC 11550]